MKENLKVFIDAVLVKPEVGYKKLKGPVDIGRRRNFGKKVITEEIRNADATIAGDA